jgi:hypothetical protein
MGARSSGYCAVSQDEQRPAAAAAEQSPDGKRGGKVAFYWSTWDSVHAARELAIRRRAFSLFEYSSVIGRSRGMMCCCETRQQRSDWEATVRAHAEAACRELQRLVQKQGANCVANVQHQWRRRTKDVRCCSYVEEWTLQMQCMPLQLLPLASEAQQGSVPAPPFEVSMSSVVSRIMGDRETFL